MKKYLLFGAVALCFMPVYSEAGGIGGARAAKRFWNKVGISVWGVFIGAPPVFYVGHFIHFLIKCEPKKANQPIYFKSGPSIFGDNLKAVPPKKLSATPCDVVRQMIIHHNSI